MNIAIQHQIRLFTALLVAIICLHAVGGGYLPETGPSALRFEREPVVSNRVVNLLESKYNVKDSTTNGAAFVSTATNQTASLSTNFPPAIQPASTNTAVAMVTSNANLAAISATNINQNAPVNYSVGGFDPNAGIMISPQMLVPLLVQKDLGTNANTQTSVIVAPSIFSPPALQSPPSSSSTYSSP